MTKPHHHQYLQSLEENNGLWARFWIYWQFSEPGDHYLGKILTGLDPKNASFGDLPPCWILNNPMDNEDASHAMSLSLSPILAKHDGSTFDPTAILLRYATYIVYHSESILSQIVRHTGHRFTKLTILHDRDLLGNFAILL